VNSNLNTARHAALVRIIADYAVDVARRSEMLRMLSSALTAHTPRPGIDDAVCDSWRTSVEETAAHHIAAVIDLASAHGFDLASFTTADDAASIRDAVEILRDREGTS
jgi:hypothetical protein